MNPPQTGFARAIAAIALGAGLGLLLHGPASIARADGGMPARELASPAAARVGASDGSEYWDLTIELENDYRVMARFLITNEGPGERNGTAVGHVVPPDGKAMKFRNGRLESGWTLSDDGLDLDIGKSHLDMHLPRYKLKVNKSDVRIRLAFVPNALYSLPKKIADRDLRMDLLALGARVTGQIQLEDMPEAIEVSGWVTLTHTISKDAETELARRRVEVFAQRGDRPFYAVHFLDPEGKSDSFAAWLEPGCDREFSPTPFPTGGAPESANAQASGPISDESCLRPLRTKTGVELVLGDEAGRPARRNDMKSYWIPSTLLFGAQADRGPQAAIEGATPLTQEEKEAISGRVVLRKEFLRYEALDDLPGPIRLLAGWSTRPRRVWSLAGFEVTLPPSLDSKPRSIQGQGVATVSFTNPVTNP